VTIEGTGSKTMAFFPVSGISPLDSVLSPLLAGESSQRLATALATASSTSVAVPRSGSATGVISRTEFYLAIDTGFKDPTRFSPQELNNAPFLSLSVSSSGLFPGQPFATIITSDPRIISSGVIPMSGDISDEVFIPLGSLEPGVHSVRLLGKRLVGTIRADSRGELKLGPESRAILAEFDSGSSTTVRLSGTNPEGVARTVSMFVPLPDNFPWWLIALLSFSLGICVAAAVWRRRARHTSVIGVALLALGFGTTAIVVAWLLASAAAVEATLGLSVLGVLATLLARFIPPATQGPTAKPRVAKIATRQSA
jgi:hypothetical protein